MTPSDLFRLTVFLPGIRQQLMAGKASRCSVLIGLSYSSSRLGPNLAGTLEICIEIWKNAPGWLACSFDFGGHLSCNWQGQNSVQSHGTKYECRRAGNSFFYRTRGTYNPVQHWCREGELRYEGQIEGPPSLHFFQNQDFLSSVLFVGFCAFAF